MIVLWFIVIALFFPVTAHAQNFEGFIAPPAGSCHALSTGEQICYTNEGGAGPGSPVRMYKNGNYEQFYIGGDGSIYRREDTSWATPDWQPVQCDSGGVASYTYAKCGSYTSGQSITDDGVRWLPPSGTEGQVYTTDPFMIVGIDRDSALAGSRQVCIPTNTGASYPSACMTQTLRYKKKYKPGEFTYCTGVKNTNDLIVIEVIGGPGTGDTFYFELGKGMTGFEAPGLKAGLVGPATGPSTCSVNPVPSVTPEPTLPDAPQSVYDLVPPTVNTTAYRYPVGFNPVVGDNNAYATTYENGYQGIACNYSGTIKQTYTSPSTTTTDDQGNQVTTYEPMTVTEVSEDIGTSGPYTNFGETKFCSWVSKCPISETSGVPTCGFPQAYVVKPERKRRYLTSYGKYGYNPVTRATTECEKKALKWQLFQEAVRSLEDDPLKRDPSLVATDQPIAWSCPGYGGCREIGLFEAGCQPMTISELVYQLREKVAWKCVGGKSIQDGIPGDISDILSRHFEGGGYERRFGFPYRPASYSGCYKNTYNSFWVTNPGCSSANIQITVTNIDADGSARPTPTPQSAPHLAAAAYNKTGWSLGSGVAARQQKKVQKTNICAMSGGYTTPHKPSPLSFFAWVKNLVAQITGKDKTVSTNVAITANYPAAIPGNEGMLNEVFYDFTPYRDQGKFQKGGSGSTAGGNEAIPYAHPGQQTDVNYDRFQNQLLPARWQL
ncbi:MAG: hypothetical protein WCT01_03550 [Candidatus Shapirobacteria bacterium]